MIHVESSDVPVFDRAFFEAEDRFTRIGDGALGGKASGLFLIRTRILPELTPDDGIEVAVPTLTVLTTEVFDKFVQRNGLLEIGMSDAPDDRIAHAFQRADLPAEVVGDLRALIAQVHTPLAIRSSSLLEDALEHPFAGVYATKMIPNNEIEEDARYRRLEQAVKLILASTFFQDSKAYIQSIGRDVRDEKMAVVIQEIIGRRFGDRFYPMMSGVARSYNYYPVGSAGPECGVVNLALGLGRSIVDGGMSWTYCPEYPRAPAPFNNLSDLLKNTQTEFWAVNMGRPGLPDPLQETECMLRAGLREAEADGVLKYLVSTYDAGSDRLDPGLGGRGPRALTFAPILGSVFIPFNDALRQLVRAAAEAVGTDVEIEIAVDADPDGFLPARIGFLQVRPMAVGAAGLEVADEELRGPDVVIGSRNVLGNGSREGIRDIVFVKPEAFDARNTAVMATEIEQLNAGLVAERRPYVLVGFGRWGTSDPFYGIPITWPQISGAKVIVEATLEGMTPDMSQGSHFFHNVISFQVLYFSVADGDDDPIRWAWLDGQETIAETEFVKHIRSSADLVIRADGIHRRGVIRSHG